MKQSASAIILNEKEEVLLQKKDMQYWHWPGCWCMFGGGSKEGETPKETILREIKEEIGLELDEVKLFKTHELENKEGKVMRYVYTSKLKKDIKDISLCEGAGFAFFQKDEISSLKMIPHDMEVLKEFLKI